MERPVADQQPLSIAGIDCSELINSNLHMLAKIHSAAEDTIRFAKV